ncbi:hypothetical protein [Planctomicrobium sp. SH527]|uniref:hypothetical protein n=1 Tax=Planctomicrobium sp. SH527 TaxID=3448123 RepID=UPI003F5BCAD4
MQRSYVRGWTLSVPVVVACAWIGIPSVVVAQPNAAAESVIPFNELAGKDKAVAADIVEPGDSSRRSRQDALAELPMSKMSPGSQKIVQEVVGNLSLFRRLPKVAIKTDRRTYDHFIQHPDVAVSIWRAMEISRVQLSETGPASYQTDTKDGTAGTVEVLYRTADSCLILCHGQLNGHGLPKPIQARALMHLQPRLTGENQLTHTCDLFVSFPSNAVEAIAKLVAPMSFKIADKNFEEISLFVSLMSNAMVVQPGWVEQLAMRLDGVSPERKNSLRNVTAQVYVEAERRRLSALGRPVTLEALMPPVAEKTAVQPTGGVKR